MKITIDIECDTINEFLSHLSVIKTQAKREMKRLKLNLDDEFPSDVALDDSNCYGDHDVTITN